jgi:hypothetical protein
VTSPSKPPREQPKPECDNRFVFGTGGLHWLCKD